MLRDGLRQLGFDADAVCISQNSKYYKTSADLYIGHLYQQCHTCVDEKQTKSLLLSSRWRHLLNYDVYIFVCSFSLLPGNEDFEVLKSHNKLIICYNTGDDFRHGPVAKELYKLYGVNHPESLSQYVPDQTRSRFHLGLQNLYLDSVARKLHSVRMAEYYADALFTLPCVSNLNIKPYMSLTVLGDPSSCEAGFPERDIPLILHSPSSAIFKNSASIISTVLSLWDEGYSFEFKMIRNVKNLHVIKSLTAADILLDQITVCGPALLALEGMASGCATLTCNESDVTITPRVRIPAVNITHENIKERLKETISDKKLRIRLARDAYEYIKEGHHSPKSVAQNMITGLYRSLDLDFDCYPTTFYDYSHCFQATLSHKHLNDLSKNILNAWGCPSKKQVASHPHFKDVNLEELKEWPIKTLKPHKWGYSSKFNGNLSVV